MLKAALAGCLPINEVFGDFFGVTRRAIDNWIASPSRLRQAVYRCRAVADAVVARALFERAKYFSYQITRTTLEIRAKKDPNGSSAAGGRKRPCCP